MSKRAGLFRYALLELLWFLTFKTQAHVSVRFLFFSFDVRIMW